MKDGNKQLYYKMVIQTRDKELDVGNEKLQLMLPHFNLTKKEFMRSMDYYLNNDVPKSQRIEEATEARHPGHKIYDGDVDLFPCYKRYHEIKFEERFVNNRPRKD